MRRPGIANLLLVAGSLAIGLLGAELCLRFASPQIFDIHPRGMYVTDDAVGYVLTPGFSGILSRPEFHYHFTINQISQRGADPRPRKANSFRVVCLGDSFTWGFGVSEAEMFTVRLEKALASRFPERDIQVINAGVPGYGTADQLHFLLSRATALDPDLVILQFLPDNDFIENRVPARDNAEVREGWLVSKQGGKDPFLGQPIWLRAHKWLKNHSHLAKLVSERLGYIAMRAGLMGNLGATHGEDFTDEDGRRAIALLQRVAATAKRLGAHTLFLFSPGQTPVVSESAPPIRAVAVVEQGAHEAGADFIDLTPIFRARTDRLALYYRLDGHWTAAGHAAVAESLFDYIVDRGYLETNHPKDPHPVAR